MWEGRGGEGWGGEGRGGEGMWEGRGGEGRGWVGRGGEGRGEEGRGGEGWGGKGRCNTDGRLLPFQIPLLAQYPQMKPCVRQAVEKAVQDYANPVLDRSIKIVLTTTEQVIKKVRTVTLAGAGTERAVCKEGWSLVKLHNALSLLQDFALNPDENVMRTAAHNMVRHLAAGMAMITCREPLLLAISTNLKSAFTGFLRVSQPPSHRPLLGPITPLPDPTLCHSSLPTP